MHKAWLFAEDRPGHSSFPDMIVFDRKLAAEMTGNNAHEAMRVAELKYPDYAWEVVKVPSHNFFVVEGTKKEK